jgi:hypothetical protein
LKKQLVAIAVILLFCGLAISPCINGDSEVKIVDIGKISEYNKSRNRYDVEKLQEQVNKIKHLIDKRNNEDCGCNDNPSSNDLFPPIICIILNTLTLNALLRMIFIWDLFYRIDFYDKFPELSLEILRILEYPVDMFAILMAVLNCPVIFDVNPYN